MTPPFTIAATTATACVRLEHSGTRHERDVEGSLAGCGKDLAALDV